MLPKSGEGRTACLTVADCGQITGFGDVLGAECVCWELDVVGCSPAYLRGEGAGWS